MWERSRIPQGIAGSRVWACGPDFIGAPSSEAKDGSLVLGEGRKPSPAEVTGQVALGNMSRHKGGDHGSGFDAGRGAARDVAADLPRGRGGSGTGRERAGAG